MPKNVSLSSQDKKQMDEGGDLSAGTKRDRDQAYDSFLAWILENKDVEDLGGLEDGELEIAICEYFFSLRVTPKV